MTNPEANKGAIRRTKALIADADDRTRMFLASGLEGWGYLVATADNAEKTSELFRDWGPDLVVMDLMGPRQRGLELCTRFSMFPTVCLIVFSSVESQDVMHQVYEAGADDFLVKGATIEEVLYRCEARLRRTRLIVSLAGLLYQKADRRIAGLDDEASARDQAPEEGGRTPKILIVDRERWRRGTTAELLRAANCIAFEASGARDALRLLGETPVDVVVLERDGLDTDPFMLAEALRKADRTKGVPVVLLTDNGTPAELVAAK